MRLEWLEDLLAVIETGSLSEASKKRFLTQPAFSRRIQSIERSVGIELFDRSRKPLRLKASVLENEARIRQLVRSMQELSSALQGGQDTSAALVLGCQHSISTAVAPTLVEALSATTQSRIRLRSANRHDCFSLLLKGEVDILLLHQCRGESTTPLSEFIESRIMGEDAFIPVTSSAGHVHDENQQLRLIAYPENAYLGQLFNRDILPQLAPAQNARWIAETALAPAALQFALSGVGIAWVPRSLAEDALMSRRVRDLSSSLPSVNLEIHALRLKQTSNEVAAQTWDWLKTYQLQQWCP